MFSHTSFLAADRLGLLLKHRLVLGVVFTGSGLGSCISHRFRQSASAGHWVTQLRRLFASFGKRRSAAGCGSFDSHFLSSNEDVIDGKRTKKIILRYNDCQ